MIEIVLAIIAAAAVFTAAAEYAKRKKMYQAMDKLLDQILERQDIGIPDLKEGELPMLAGKAVRIQEKMDHEIDQAQEEKEQVKSLISNMSHQLKTPLSNVIMYRDLLEGDINQEQKDMFLKKMKLQLDKIDWILQSLFKMVRLEQGAIQFETAPASLKKTLQNAINTVYGKAEKKDIQIITVPFHDLKLLYNSKWTSEVFVNILENAIKYSQEHSQVQIQVFPMELFTEIRFTDSGIGIREQELNEIFKRFYRSSEVEHKEGAGIGLYLSRLILEQEKAYMTVASEHGHGSSFSVFLQNCQN